MAKKMVKNKVREHVISRNCWCKPKVLDYRHGGTERDDEHPQIYEDMVKRRNAARVKESMKSWPK